jgi:Ca-activated chloride channel family protein
MTVKLRYKAPDADQSRLTSVTVRNHEGALGQNAGFAAAVAEFGMLLRHSDHRGSASYEEAASLARRFRGTDSEGYRAEFARLVELAGAIR